MQSINFDDGYKEFMINDDPNKVIHFSPADFSILERFNVARKRIVEIRDNITDDIKLNNAGEPLDELGEAAAVIGKVSALIREQVDYIFDSKVSDMVFGNTSPLAMVKGKPLFERFIEAAQPFIEKEIRSEMAASEKRINKYISQVK
jgi:hypothetical protein